MSSMQAFLISIWFCLLSALYAQNPVVHILCVTVVFRLWEECTRMHLLTLLLVDAWVVLGLL